MLKPEELTFITQSLGLPHPLNIIKPLGGGDVNSAYQATCGSTRYVVKTINKAKYVQDYAVELEKLMESLRFSEQIASQLSGTGHVMSAYFAFEDCLVQTANDLILLYPQLDAVVRENQDLSSSHVRQVAAFLAQLHRSSLQFNEALAQEKLTVYKQIGEKIITLSVWDKLSFCTHPSYFFPKINTLSTYLVTHRDPLLKALNALKGTVLCHNDLKPKNVLWENNHFWVVDWETAGLFDQTADYLDTLLAWCTVYDKRGVSLDETKLQAFMETYPLPTQSPLLESLSIVLIKWYFWLAFCLNKLMTNPRKFKNNLWHIRYSIQFICFLMDGAVISRIEKKGNPKVCNPD
ncbi:phosphotransferase [Legionella sp. MW5194]|uniref:aminoglycoside phosphotransferase family protein n=1 Tax=Legionella sp. MW5194 TaxID=2662448 RepID=UPI00193DD572|nr:aminoglycoside phosphotransferase family protein [Legionella sp. MW5194]QRN02806.1 phosphotransferase [Legionella sp. MW5194]